MSQSGPSARVLILTASYGEGHNAAARALALALDRVGGPGTSHVVDLFALGSPRVNAVLRPLYLRLINDAPRVWSRVYDWIDRSRFLQRRMWLFRAEIRLLRQLLAEEAPVAICCTYPVYAYFLEHLAQSGCEVPPVFNVVTDSISIHSLWWRAGCDGWFLPNADSAEVVLRAGVPRHAVHVSGFPVPAVFTARPLELHPPDLASGTVPRVLHIINSGTRHAAETARQLLTQTDWDITCAVGRDTRLQAQLLRIAQGRAAPTRVLGWTDQIPPLLMTRHVVVSKAGGATTQEAIAAQCPMIVSQVVPGQEEGNWELIRRHGAGALAESPEAVLAVLRQAFADGGTLWRTWRTALRAMTVPNAAEEIARHVLSGRTAARTRPAAALPATDFLSPAPHESR